MLIVWSEACCGFVLGVSGGNQHIFIWNLPGGRGGIMCHSDNRLILVQVKIEVEHDALPRPYNLKSEVAVSFKTRASFPSVFILFLVK